MSRPYDIVILGATGFTGRLVADYLLRSYGTDGDLTWAMAGRDHAKLDRVRRELTSEDVPLLVADVRDPASLDDLTRQTKVLCTTVGPYAKYGSEVVASCVRMGAHYCDLSGEVPWMRRMIDAHHAAAAAKKLRIVHSCGFDSIPSEMGVLYLQQQAKKQTGTYCTEIKTGLKGASGGFSGGTIASLTNVLAEAEQDRRIYKILFNPYSLNPEDQQEGPDGPDLRTVAYDADFGSWKCPFLMASINTRIVRRSQALLGRPYGADFQYSECMLTGAGWAGRVKAYVTSIPLALLMGAKPGSLARKLIDWFLPKPGEGPSAKERENGFWVYDLVGRLPDGQLLRARVKGDRDPGYGSTSKMLAEAAICLAKDELPEQYGVITPAAAMGEPLLKRLQERAGLTFRMRDKN
jgi:short subunit dehydrogenase-like uncharacterized protein